MKYVLVVAVTLLAATAQAATPEEDYLAARDGYIAKLNPPGDMVAPTDAATKQMEQARDDLARRMRGMIGPLNVKGFSGEGAYSVGSLFRGDMEFGILDGLEFRKGKDTRLVVTTTDLATAWVKSKDGMTDDGVASPDLRSVMKLELFYTRGTTFDAAVGDYGELPVTKPAGVDFVFAMLSGRRQDTVPVTPQEVLVGAIVPPRVYIVSMPAAAKIKVMAPCRKLWTDAVAKEERIARAAVKNASLAAEAEVEVVRDKGEEAMRKCFAERAKNDLAYARLVRQAQEMVDTLAAK